VGEKLRNRCRQFPSIINCCTIDWFERWPNEALFSVAIKEFKAKNEKLGIGIGDFIDKLSEMTVFIHNSVIDFSDKFYGELRRKNYVTPTSYLELLKLYIEMMKYQQGILPQKISKYTVGLETLKETNEEVSKLKQKIIEMQPKLEEFARETALMVVELEK
jgi:dynein heavy chain